MTRFANVCTRCNGTRLEASMPKQQLCAECDGSGYKLTEAGAEIRDVVLALLRDPEIKNELAGLFKEDDD